jgi:alkanesulfonate monooxygenase SsuD/methylene tetrahydromethanopterin reductase-like flavin-dependent oxidoreductase (luciferase family)
MSTRKLLLAVEAGRAGAHPAAWRSPGATAAAYDPGSLRHTAAIAEQAGFAFAAFADEPVPPPGGAAIEAGVRASYLARLTSRIGLAPTLHATTTEPFHLATQLASLDHASRGRAAWVVGSANSPDARATIGADPLDDSARIREVRDVVAVARALWDSWEDDAVIKDVQTGRFLDNDKVHHVRFTGESFTVVGPLITPRPPQGQVVVIAPDSLGAADLADITLVGASPPADRLEAEALGRRAERARAAGSPLVFAELEVALSLPGASAATRLDRLDARQAWPPSGRLRFSGTAGELTAHLGRLAAQVDGVLLYPLETAVDLPILAQDVLPALAAAGLARVPGPGQVTLRDVLGLPRPANRFAAAVAAPGGTGAPVHPVRSHAGA